MQPCCYIDAGLCILDVPGRALIGHSVSGCELGFHAVHKHVPLGLTRHGKLSGCGLRCLLPVQAILPVELILLLQGCQAVIQPLQHVSLAC